MKLFRYFPVLYLFLAIPLAGASAAEDTPERPNIIFVMTDDQGMGDFSLYGNPVVKTPNLDRLAKEGVSFSQFHVTSMCSPTRAAFLTGKDTMNNGVISTCQGYHTLREEHVTLPEVLQDAGYATGLFGKWHLGRNYPNRPEDNGFDEALTLYGFGPTGISSRWNNDYVDTWVVHNGEDRQLEGFCTDAFFDEAMSWMKEQTAAEKPFFAYISTNAPHFPFWAPKEWTEEFADTLNPEFFAMVKNIDDNMARLDEFLEAEGIKDNTLLVFTSDNGAVGGRETWNAGMRGGKATPWEGGHRVPLFVRYPDGNIAGGNVVDGQSDIVDIFPTMLEICGIDQPENAGLDGISLRDAMLGKSELPERFRVMTVQQKHLDLKHTAGMRGPWRLLWSDSLYNIEEDLEQQEDIARDKSDVFIDLWKEMQSYYHERKNYALDAPAEVIGSPNQKTVILDSSNWLMKRSDGQPNVRKAKGRSYGPDGGDWKIKAEVPGIYRVTLHRWPVESGLELDEGCPPFQSVCSGKPLPEGVALPITQATLDVGSIRYSKEAEENAAGITFEVELDDQVHLMRGIFRDEDGNPLCGSFYAYVEKAGTE